VIFGINTTRDISKLSQISRAIRRLSITISKYHSWYLRQISLQIILLPILIISFSSFSVAALDAVESSDRMLLHWDQNQQWGNIGEQSERSGSLGRGLRCFNCPLSSSLLGSLYSLFVFYYGAWPQPLKL